jgi:phage repressor protein C with HTH and peptisase S24 domain
VTGRPSKGKSKTPGLEDGPVVFRVELGERIRILLDMFRSRPEAAAIAGVTPEHLASYIGGRAKPPFELLARLAQAKDVSLEWLATGQGRQSLGEVIAGFAAIPVAEADAYSGPGSYPLAEDVREHIAFSRAWLHAAIRTPEARLCVVFNRGDANEPDIMDGDAMLVSTGLDRVTDDGYYVFKPDGRLITRKVQIYVDGRVSLQTQATMDKKPPEILSPEEAARIVFGRVRWRGGLL